MDTGNDGRFRDAFDLYELSVKCGIGEQHSLGLALTALGIRRESHQPADADFSPEDFPLAFSRFREWAKSCEPKNDAETLWELICPPGKDVILFEDLRRYNDELGLNIQESCLDEMMQEAATEESREITLDTFASLLQRMKYPGG
eukprot:GEMP01075670.1.p1 GENE.GEMP01075670.1~~GEMP01075670.1.p1  ORF type:complete len:145 (+),score=31.04 GEMP01075670.1:67-501(+)